MRRTKGFTLIELLVVIAIIGILASIVMVSLSGAKQKSRDAKRQADIKSIQLALSLYYSDNGMYPKNIYSTSGTAPDSGLAPIYLPTVPKDPSTSITCGDSQSAGCYKYVAYAVGTTGAPAACTANNFPPASYHLGADMEDTSGSGGLSQDVDADTGGTYLYTNLARCTAGVTGAAAFNGNAPDCIGASAMTAPSDGCYDVAP